MAKRERKNSRLPIRIQTALMCLIAAPLAMLGWIGFALIRGEELNAKRQFATLADGRLLELVRSIDDVMSSHNRHIKQLMELDGNLSEQLMLLERTEPRVRRTMWVSARGQLLYPPAPAINVGNEFLLYNELSLMARQRPPVPVAISRERTLRDNEIATASFPGVSELRPTVTLDQETIHAGSPWHQSYFDEGLQLVVWSLRPDGSAIGCWLERARWMADLIAILPVVDNPASSDGMTALSDANGDVVYRWGASDVAMELPVSEVALMEPLGSWRLKYYLTANRTAASTWIRYWRWGLAISTVALSLLGLGAYVTIATTRQLRLANQRVSFVGQVSHELRTPLTNIRLYAEMARRDLTQKEPAVHRIAERLEVIDSESKRLSRLISGVLDLIQGRSKAQPLTWQPVVPDEIIRHVLTQCKLSLDRNGILISSDLNAGQRVEMDSDVLEQILINLINNVEKYAAMGKSLRVSSSLNGESLAVDVCDCGPGVPPRFKHKIFQAFFRLEDGNTAPSGTGLGLTIARQAAKRHGGGLELIPSQTGSHFRLWLRIRYCNASPSGVET